MDFNLQKKKGKGRFSTIVKWSKPFSYATNIIWSLFVFLHTHLEWLRLSYASWFGACLDRGHSTQTSNDHDQRTSTSSWPLDRFNPTATIRASETHYFTNFFFHFNFTCQSSAATCPPHSARLPDPKLGTFRPGFPCFSVGSVLSFFRFKICHIQNTKITYTMPTSSAFPSSTSGSSSSFFPSYSEKEGFGIFFVIFSFHCYAFSSCSCGFTIILLFTQCKLLI